MAPKELKVLRLLMKHPRGLYGSELVVLSGGYLTRGTIYCLLFRLAEKGLVQEMEEPITPALQMYRTRNFITKAGTRAVEAYAREMGFTVQP